MKCVIVFGSPGSGKGDLCRALKGRFKVHHVETGALFRAMKTDPQFAENVALMGKGKLLGDDLATDVVSVEFDRGLAANPDWLFLPDGYPRSVKQGEALLRLLDERKCDGKLLLQLWAPRAVCMERMRERAQKDNRPDDMDPAVIADRLDTYESNAAPTLAILTANMPYTYVDATKNKDQVFDRTREVLAPMLA